MRKILVFAPLSLMLMFAVGRATPQEAAPPAHTLAMPADLAWGPPPPFFPAGAKFVILFGDPGKPGPVAVRMQMPAGYRIAPHWHPGTEQVTVISGSVAFGMGDTFDEKTMKTLGAGGYAVMPAEMRHYVKAKTAAMIEVHGIGPFAINYVNPADAPNAAPPAK